MSEGVAVGSVEREALDRVRERIAALRRDQYRLLEDIADLERRGLAAATGDRLVERLVQDLGRFDRREADRLVDETADLAPRWSLSGEPLPPRLPATALVFAAGQAGPGHVVVIRRAMGRLDRVEGLDPAEWVEAEESLAEAATRLSPDGLARVAARLLAHLDPDGVAPEPGAEREDELRVLTRRDGSLAIRGAIRSAVNAEVIREGFGVAALPAGPEDERSLANRQAAALAELMGHALGPQGMLGDDPARPAAVNGDAAHEDAADENAGTNEAAPGDAATEDAAGENVAPEDAAAEDASTNEAAAPDAAAEGALIPEPRRPEPTPAPAPASAPTKAGRREPARSAGRALLTITVDHRWLRQAVGHGTLDSQALTDVHTVRRWACDAEIIPMVLGSKSEPLDVGRLSRTVTDAIRRALNLRDGGCAFPSCTRRPRRCHAHHIHHWIDGGATELDNLVLLCLHHHQLVHHGQWTVAVIDGVPWFTPPPWIDPAQRPRPGGRPRVPL